MDIPEIDIAALAASLDSGAPLIDVRQPEEFAEARVAEGKLIPLDQVPDSVGELPTDSTVYVICRSGGRSAKAVEFLRQHGVDAVNVAGGTLAWIESGRAVVSDA